MPTPEHKFGKEISDALQTAGFTVIDMESLGNGVPDRIASKEGRAFYFETKMKGKWLTKHQEVWIKTLFKNNLPYYVLIKTKNGLEIKEIKAVDKRRYCIIHHIETDFIKFIEKEVFYDPVSSVQETV